MDKDLRVSLSKDAIRVDFHPQPRVKDSLYQYAVIVSRYRKRWIFCMHGDRNTWEIPGGKRETGEAILRTARRELYEETGAVDYHLLPLCAYAVSQAGKARFGLLCFAEVQRLSPLPSSEIARIALFDTLPERLTYPKIQPMLFDKALTTLYS